MSNYGLDGEQQEAIQWSIKALRNLIEMAEENIKYYERQISGRRAKELEGGRYFQRITKKIEETKERIVQYKQKIETFEAMLPSVTEKK